MVYVWSQTSAAVNNIIAIKDMMSIIINSLHSSQSQVQRLVFWLKQIELFWCRTADTLRSGRCRGRRVLEQSVNRGMDTCFAMEHRGSGRNFAVAPSGLRRLHPHSHDFFASPIHPIAHRQQKISLLLVAPSAYPNLTLLLLIYVVPASPDSTHSVLPFLSDAPPELDESASKVHCLYTAPMS